MLCISVSEMLTLLGTLSQIVLNQSAKSGFGRNVHHTGSREAMGF